MATVQNIRRLRANETHVTAATTTTPAAPQMSDEQRMRYYQAIYSGAIPDPSARPVRGRFGIASVSHSHAITPAGATVPISSDSAPSIDRRGGFEPIAASESNRRIAAIQQTVAFRHSARERAARRIGGGELSIFEF